MAIHVDYAKWKVALLSTFFISSVPNLMLYLIPNSWLKKNEKRGINVQNVLLTFAAGGLLGDVILHIIPHLLLPHDHHVHESAHAHHTHSEDHNHPDHDSHIEHSHGRHLHTSEVPPFGHDLNEEHHHDHDRALWVGLFILAGFLMFFLGEKMLSVYLSEPVPQKETAVIPSSSWMPESLSTMGWLNISADLMHNFTDGVAMGASCAASSMGSAGVGGSALMAAATLSIFCHEVPHEIGDFAVLVQSGISKSKAIQIQFMTSVAAFAGTIVGLLSEGHRVWQDAMLALTAGGFIYVAAVSLIPSVLSADAHSHERSPPPSPVGEKKRSAKRGGSDLRRLKIQAAVEAIAFSLGVAMMAVVALTE